MSLLSQQELGRYLGMVNSASPEQRKKIFQLLDLDKVERCKESFLFFVQQMWPVFISGQHHKIMADAFERVARGELKRLIINMPPRHTKSEFASYLLPAWFLGRFPQKKIIQTAHTAELAVGFGRKVRNLVQSEFYQKVFQTKLSSDSKAAGRWNTEQGGDYFAIGVGGAVTGKGADILVIDDPHSEQEAKQGNPAVYDNVYEWYTSGPRQRLQPGGAIIIVMCMTGDTPVLMADGTEKPLVQIRPGDLVATFEEGRLTTSKVNNWQSSGVDSIYRIQTKSGRILRANERHPFLVMNKGVMEWTRLNQLMVGDDLVSLKGAADHQEQKQNRECAELVQRGSHTTAKTQILYASQLEVMADGLASCANAESQSPVKGFVSPATESNTHVQSQLQKKTEQDELNTATGSRWNNSIKWLKSATIAVMSAANNLLGKTPAPTGEESSVSTMITPLERCADSSATIATLQLDTEKRQMFLNELQRISDFTVDPIISITPDGQEEVFDVEIDRTENFIANGVVSHNTRWSKRDLTGQILKNSSRDGTDDWEVIEFPAILPSGNPLWPGFWKKTELEAIKAEIPVGKWEAQYQQNPTSEEGAIVKRDQWKIWESEDPPDCEYIIQSWDTAFEKHNRADFSACTTWGVFRKENEKGQYKPNIILLDAFKERMEFPDLKAKAYDLWKYWNPDTLIVEKRAAGSPLIYELRKIGIPLSEYTPYKGQDKIARVNSIADLFASGVVWRPETRWAEEVVEEMASFPNGDHDDLVDSSSQALMRFRQGGFISVASDEDDGEETFLRRRVEYY
jgi:predicted phage terminase large subunit-like protein